MEFLVRGASQYGEPGVFIAFEENEKDLLENFGSLKFSLDSLVTENKIALDHVFVERSEIEETGEYDLEGLFIRLEMAINQVNAKRVVLDTIESLFSGFTDETVLRAELRRLFRWLKDKGVTAIITAERGAETFSRHGLEEYVADCVIVLDHRVEGQLSTRRLRVVKYRGSAHGPDEYPFLIHVDGLSLLPITSLGLNHIASSERVSSGIDRLDMMLSGQGYYRGSTVLVSGAAGTGKSSLAAHFVNAACNRGERALYLAFEESESQIVRNMKSIGFNLDKHVKKNLLMFHSVRPTMFGLESHLTQFHRIIEEFKPDVIVIDPISNLVAIGNTAEVKSMLVRLIDFLKSKQITTLCTDLTSGGAISQATEIGISSLTDTWILLGTPETSGERNRTLSIVKSRGMEHSHQIREFQLTGNGIQLIEVYVGSDQFVIGSARVAQEAQDAAEASARKQKVLQMQAELERKRALFEAEVAALKAKFEYEQSDIQRIIEAAEIREVQLEREKADLAIVRKADAPVPPELGNQTRKGKVS
jgi:circadian clock protein KaiC